MFVINTIFNIVRACTSSWFYSFVTNVCRSLEGISLLNTKQVFLPSKAVIPSLDQWKLMGELMEVLWQVVRCSVATTPDQCMFGLGFSLVVGYCMPFRECTEDMGINSSVGSWKVCPYLEFFKFLYLPRNMWDLPRFLNVGYTCVCHLNDEKCLLFLNRRF